MTEPTDAEIRGLAHEGNGVYQDYEAAVWEITDPSLIKFARAVLAKWGTPPAVEEPFGWLYEWTHSSATGRADETYTGFTKDEQHARKHDNCRAVYTTPQPTQTQAGAVPLTEEQRSDIATAAAGFNWTDDYVEAIDYVIDGVESLHGIKGGRHGAE